MIIHCSQKLAAKLPEVSKAPIDDLSPLGGWHAHLFTLDRRQCVMFCHDATRYVLFLPGLRKAQFGELGSKWFRQSYTATLAMSGCTDAQISKAELALGPVRFDTATDRSVQSSLNIAKQDLECWLDGVPSVMDLDPLAMSSKLNERPVTIRGNWLRPEKAMLEMISSL